MKKESILLVLIILFGTNLILAGELRVTQEHPFFVDGVWVQASDLQVGDELMTSSGQKVRITSIEDVSSPTEVYNLDSSETDDFVVGEENIVVHNSEEPVYGQEFDCYQCEECLIGNKNTGYCGGPGVLQLPEYSAEINKPLVDLISGYNARYTNIPKDKLKDVLPPDYAEKAIRELEKSGKDTFTVPPGDRKTIAPPEYETAINEHIRVNQRYILKLAFNRGKRHIQSGDLSKEDLLSLGSEGWNEALTHLDSSFKTEVGTYADYWIKQKINREVRLRRARDLQVKYLPEGFDKIRSAIENIRLEKPELTKEEIIKILKERFSDERIDPATMYEHIQDYERCVESLDRTYDDSGDKVQYKDTKSPDPQEEAICNEETASVEDLVNSDIISDRDRGMLQDYYNLRSEEINYPQEVTLEGLAIKLGMSEGGFSKEEIDYTMSRYHDYLEDQGTKNMKNILSKIKDDVKSKYGREPNLFANQLVGHVITRAEKLLRSRGLWEVLNDKIKIENQKIKDKKISMLTPRQLNIMNLYHGVGEYNGEPVVRRHTFEEIGNILGKLTKPTEPSTADDIRRSYHEALNRLDREYGLGLESQQAFQEKWGANCNGWKSSLKDDPSLCKSNPDN